jgi:Putative Ig domain
MSGANLGRAVLVLLMAAADAAAALNITTASPLPNAAVTAPYSQTLSASGGTPPCIWSAGTGLPPGLTINSTTGNSCTGGISGTPSLAGMYTFTVQVSDSLQQSATQTFSITVTVSPVSITTKGPLFNGIVGTPYSQTFSASGGTKPYHWSIVSGSIAGLQLDSLSGTLQGTPQTAGTFSFTVQVTDSAGARATGSFSVIVGAPTLTIVTSTSLPSGTAGDAYSQQFSVVGGTPPYTWSLTQGSVPGLTFDATQVVLAGTPATAGTYTFTLQAGDSAGVTTSRSFTVVINPTALIITTGTQLPNGTLGGAYSYQISASGGIPPYTWSAVGLPAGLTIDPNTGIISGTLTDANPPAFAVRVVDSVRVSATSQFRISVALPNVPAVTLSGLPSTVLPAQQFSLQISIGSPFPTDITGQALLTFSPAVGGSDGTIQFSTGGTTASFTIPAGKTSATAALALQTGTVAGQIGVSLRLQAGGRDITPSPAPAVSASITPAAPVIQSATLVRSANGFSIQIAGYSTAREVTQAVFTFSPASGQTLQVSQITIAVDTLFGAWYQDAANNAYGSQFVFTQPFTIQGDASAVIPGSVTLTNRQGSVTATVSQ